MSACVKDGDMYHAIGDICCSNNKPCTTTTYPSGSTPPSPIRKISEYYLWSWLHHPTDPQIILPSNYNLAITFSGWGASQSNLFGLLPDSYPLASSQSGHNYISIGGGADIGAWNSNDLDPSLWQNNIIPNAKKRKYTGPSTVDKINKIFPNNGGVVQFCDN